MSSPIVRLATAADIPTVFQLIQELSAQENVSEKPQLTVSDLLHDGAFELDDGTTHKTPRFTCVVASNDDDDVVVGFALCFFKRFTCKRRVLFVDSLHARRRHAGQSHDDIEPQLIRFLHQHAIENGCFRIELHVLQRNDALAELWREVGAINLTSTTGQHLMRLHADAITALLDARSEAAGGIGVRLARREDVNEILVMIDELAVFERLCGDPKLSAEDLCDACGFVANIATSSAPQQLPDIVIFVAETQSTADDTDASLVGYLILMHAYSSRSGAVLAMKNMFVRESHRAAGVGRALFQALAAFARATGCRHEENHVLDWNRQAVQFYRRMGAVDLTETESWHYWRVPLDCNREG